MFKKGDKVYSLRHGWGEVIDDCCGHPLYSIRVKSHHDGVACLYTVDGKCWADDSIQDLYHGIPEIIAPPEPVRAPEWTENIPEKGVLCWVSDNEKAGRTTAMVVKKFIPDEKIPFIVIDGFRWRCATPVTKEDLE